MTRRLPARRNGGEAFTLMESLLAATIGVVLLGVLTAAAAHLGRSMFAADHFARSSNDGSRLVDYVVQDLRRAVGVGILIEGVLTPLKNGATATVSESTTLSIHIPDFYASNTPGGSGDAAFRTPRYAREDLNKDAAFNAQGLLPLNGTVQWGDAVTKVDGVETTRFSPTSLGHEHLEVRYYRARRSSHAPATCYFRAEHTPGAAKPNFPPQELADGGATIDAPVTLTVLAPILPATDPRQGKLFHVMTSFTPRFHRGSVDISAEQRLTVLLRNARRD